jgi:hypothetical protein
MPRHYAVTMVGKDGHLHSIETDADSLFAAAYAGIRSSALLWWCDSDAVVEVRSADGAWKVSAAQVSAWYREGVRQSRSSSAMRAKAREAYHFSRECQGVADAGGQESEGAGGKDSLEFAAQGAALMFGVGRPCPDALNTRVHNGQWRYCESLVARAD